jgi:hypothetical protein
VIVDNSPIKKEDLWNVIRFVGENPNGRYFAWYFIREYFPIFGASKDTYDAIFRICQTFDNVYLFDEVTQYQTFEFFQSNSFFFLMHFKIKIYAFFDTIPYDEKYVERQLQIIFTVINTIYWAADREADFAKYFFEFGKK